MIPRLKSMYAHFLKYSHFKNFAWILRPMSEELCREKPSIRCFGEAHWSVATKETGINGLPQNTFGCVYHHTSGVELRFPNVFQDVVIVELCIKYWTSLTYIKMSFRVILQMINAKLFWLGGIDTCCVYHLSQVRNTFQYPLYIKTRKNTRKAFLTP